MAETDILNPQMGWWAAINDNPNPSYGYTRRSAANSALAKARLGPPYSRETLNQGYAFEFAYVDRPWTTMLRLKQFYENFKGGYFTYIDYDAGSRNHVGRFTTPINPQETSNGKWTAQGILFEEMPQARMVTYPNDFVNWSRRINVVDDFLNPTVATLSAASGTLAIVSIEVIHLSSPARFALVVTFSSAVPAYIAGQTYTFSDVATFTALNGSVLSPSLLDGSFGADQQVFPYESPVYANTADTGTATVVGGGWVTQLNPSIAGASANVPADYEVYNAVPSMGDYAQVEYVGWGFKTILRIGAGMGQAAIYVDGVQKGIVDQSSGTAVGVLDASLTLALGVLTCTNLSLDKHRFKLVALAVAGGIGSGTAVNFQPLTVIV